MSFRTSLIIMIKNFETLSKNLSKEVMMPCKEEAESCRRKDILALL
jgi:hypothetical protein